MKSIISETILNLRSKSLLALYPIIKDKIPNVFYFREILELYDISEGLIKKNCRFLSRLIKIF